MQAIDADGEVFVLDIENDEVAGLLFDDRRETVIAISAVTRGTAEPASYSWTLSP